MKHDLAARFAVRGAPEVARVRRDRHPPAPGDVVVRIHDLRGHTLRTFRRDGADAQTRHEIRWNGRDEDGRSLPSGVYLYQLESNGHSTSKRMSLIR